MLKSWFLDKIAEHNLTSKKYKEMKSLMNMLYDFAIESNLTNSNVSRAIHGISYKKTGNTAYLGACLNFTLALRVGEVVTLKTSDFSETLVHIQRTEIKHYDKLDYGEIVRNGYEVVPHGKTPNADRELFLTRNAKELQ